MDSPVIVALRDLGLDPVALADGGGIAVRVPSQRRGSFVVQIAERERTVALRAFIMRCPDRAHADVYARLLFKNMNSAEWRFAVDADGDVYLAANVPGGAAFLAGLDELLGMGSVLVDEVYEGIVRTGFDIPEGQSLRPPRAESAVDEG